MAFSFLVVIFQIVTEGVRDFSCTDSGCIGLQVTPNDSLLHSMAENKTEHWYPGYNILGTRVQNAIINKFLLLTLAVKLVKNSHLKMQRMAHQNFW